MQKVNINIDIDEGFIREIVRIKKGSEMEEELVLL